VPTDNNGVDHGAAASAIGYLYQTNWALLELLRRASTRPDQALTLERHDDVSWDQSGTATELLQLKHHISRQGGLGDASPDLWRTLRVWMDHARPGDTAGPLLVLVTTASASIGSAAALLRDDAARRPEEARTLLEHAAGKSENRDTEKSRAQFLALSSAERQVFLSRTYVSDGAAAITDLDAAVRQQLWSTLPTEPMHADTYMELVWQWWARVSLDILSKRRPSVDVSEAKAQLAHIRDMFTAETLPTLIELEHVDEEEAVALHSNRPFVHQMRWVNLGPQNLIRSIVDYHRAVTQTTDWLDRDLVGVAELTRFEMNLKDEWARAFEDMVEDLPADADEDTKAEYGRLLLRRLRDSTAVTVRSRYTDPFFARGKRHELADDGHVGWHPEFQARLEALLAPSA
jgi:hypothetical protein